MPPAPAPACRYAAGATVQIILFGVLAVEVKRKAPKWVLFSLSRNVRW